MESINASSMIKTGEKMFELLDKWVDQVVEENVVQVILDSHSSYKMTVINTTSRTLISKILLILIFE